MRILLLTSTISPPRNTISTKLTDPELRFKQTQQSIEYWIKQRIFDRIYLVDNSGYPQIKTQCDRFKMLSFVGNSRNVYLYGKGSGEMEIIRYFFDNVELNSDDIIYKVTGRLRILNYQKNSSAEIGVRLRRNLSFSDSRYLYAPKHFYTNYLTLAECEVDEPRGVFFEHLLAKATLKALSESYQLNPLPTPLIDGVSGTTGFQYKNNIFIRILSFIETYLTKYLFAR